ncbi:phosphate ABC transporter, periplasmic phosphate-binding protein [Staphylothermus hellenicus DSM 12710]|uniref:Phosphate-binding protein n=2 Tax=Staphylothermus hellenicus TaxID=84599 RepID=D7DA34_STAHD|nr:phosphate ABC transporter, periplasmic phosphate-binding protein [Staphylothermus hellenicus DSM 12710]
MLKNKTIIITAVTLALIILSLLIYNFYISNTYANSNPETTTRIYIRGSGATFPLPLYEEWFKEFMNEQNNIVVDYEGIGSGAGQEQFFKGLTDFCGSDPPLSHDKWLKYKGKVLQLPTILGAVVVAYNIPEIPGNTHLNISGEVLALIYKGEIEYWDDPHIKSINPEIADKLPHEKIIAAHRSDASGTTQIFTTFLHKSAPDIWPEELVGKTIDWPIDKTGRGIGGKGNPGVTSVIVNTKYSIGYIEYQYAIKNNLPIATVMNREGVFVLPSKTTIQSAAKYALNTGLIPDSPDKDFSKELDAIIYAPGKDSYPITAFSHIFVWKHYDNKEKADAIKKLIEWIYTEDSKHVIEGYVAVPDEIKDIALKSINMIEG